MSSKRLARAARFRSLLGNVADGPPKDWMQMAAASYADQSHLIREFAEFAEAMQYLQQRGLCHAGLHQKLDRIAAGFQPAPGVSTFDEILRCAESTGLVGQAVSPADPPSA